MWTVFSWAWISKSWRKWKRMPDWATVGWVDLLVREATGDVVRGDVLRNLPPEKAC